MSFIDRTGQRNGRLSVVEFVGRDKFGGILWKCLCECGNERIVSGSNLATIFSCGCLRKELAGAQNRTHGGSRTPTYRSWSAMKDRCFRRKSHKWLSYGGRGITVDPRWLGERGFENFVRDLGPRPEGMTLDRIDPNGNYEKSNCRWALPPVQTHNQRKRTATSSRFKGVCWEEQKQRFTAHITVGKKQNFLGTFISEIEAAQVYNQAAKKYYGDFAHLNEIPQQVAV